MKIPGVTVLVELTQKMAASMGSMERLLASIGDSLKYQDNQLCLQNQLLADIKEHLESEGTVNDKEMEKR